MTVRVRKWGNSLGVRVPRSVARAAQIREGAELTISYRRGKVILSPQTLPTLKQLLARVEPGNRPEVADWGGPVGAEVW